MTLTCAFSGHRPEKLPWREDESDPRCLALKIQMERQLRALCQEGCLRYLCGMARGTDLIAVILQILVAAGIIFVTVRVLHREED